MPPLLLGALLGIVLAGCASASSLPDAGAPEGRPTTSQSGSASLPSTPWTAPAPTEMDPGDGGHLVPTRSPGPTQGSPPPLAEPQGSVESPASSTAADLATFLENCELGIREWRAGQVDYPTELVVEVGGSVAYVAAVDARDTPVDPGEAIPGPSATGEAVGVRCEVAARLSPSGDGLAVDETDWVLRRFTPTGFIRWSWTVTAKEGGDEDLELELQPAIRTDDGRVEVGNSTLEVSTFITRAHVAEDAIQQAGSWMESHKGPLAVIAAALAAAAIGVVRFGREFATEMRQTITAWSGDATEPEDSPSRTRDGDIAP